MKFKRARKHKPTPVPPDVAQSLAEVLTEVDQFLRVCRLLAECPMVGITREQMEPVAGHMTDTIMRLIEAAKPLQRAYLQIAVELAATDAAGGRVQ